MSYRDRSKSPNRKKLKYDKQEKESSKCREKNEHDFSFLDHKYSLDKLIYGYHSNDKLIEDVTDFWRFVQKYEALIKKTGKHIAREATKDSGGTSDVKRNCIFIHVDDKLRRSLENVIQFDKRSELTKHRIDVFYDIVTTYLDFKQKEKFGKLDKLRQCQKSLPVFKYKENIIESVKNNQITILAGDTGCGKSTQIPQYLHYNGFENIVCTQPRRLACIALSKRVAHEMLSEYNAKVGYQIRFEKHKNKETDICFITEGLLLRQLTVSDQLEQYDVIILDEIHERNLHGDFLLGVAKCLLRARPDLKLILMSATINVGLFSKFFEEEKTSLIEVPGRLYPIKTYYMPPMKTEMQYNSRTKEERFSAEPYVQILNLIDQKYPLNEKGDVLIFISGVNEIETVMDAAKEYAEKQKHWIILPLHSGLSLADQDKVFDYAPEGLRKCIVSTNIAETSVTVDGVRFVVDSGKMKEMIYDSSSKMQRLKEFWVSKSSAEQRKGRAGRTGPGVCYRIYSEKNFDQFDSYSTPEICRVPLDSMLLQMVAMGLPNVRLFPFIEAPSQENIEQAILSLKQHVAIGPDEKITTLGKSLSMLPVDISIGKMLLMGSVFEELQRVLTLAAALSIQSPFTHRAFRDQKCELARRAMQSDQGDPLTLLNTFKEWLEQKWRRNENTRRWCRQIGVEEQRFYELSKLRNQFENILKSCNLLLSSDNENLSSAERAVRNGEVRTLRAMRRTHKMSAPNKRKVIKRSDLDREEDDDDGGNDIRDVEFRLSNDSRRLDNLIQSTSATSHREVLVLKLILVSGLYPQIAIPDEFNYCKNGSQQFFHTFLKPFVSLHPNGQFADMTEILKLADSDIVEKPPFYTSKVPLSSAHQILCYQNLLETTKPYLLNVVRMPAAQTLLLFSLAIDTNTTVSKIVCDSWLCLEFPFPEQGLHMLEKAIHIRNTWHKMLSDKLSEPLSDATEQSDNKRSKSSYREQSRFMNDLAMFMKADVCYTLKRLLPADVKQIYTQYTHDEHKLPFNPFIESYEMTPNANKGGYNITDNVVYGCLHETPWSLALQDEMRRIEWICEECGVEVELLRLSKLLHRKKCIRAEKSTEEDEVQEKDPHTTVSSTHSKTFVCVSCSRSFQMTSIEILKHKRSCKNSTK